MVFFNCDGYDEALKKNHHVRNISDFLPNFSFSSKHISKIALIFKIMNIRKKDLIIDFFWVFRRHRYNGVPPLVGTFLKSPSHINKTFNFESADSDTLDSWGD